jgi:hypothetical protein
MDRAAQYLAGIELEQGLSSRVQVGEAERPIQPKHRGGLVL